MSKPKQSEMISYDAPPLDFSFKNIKHLQQIKTIQPRQGTRLNPVDEDGKFINPPKKQEKQGETENAEQSQKNETTKQEKKKVEITKLLPENNINSVVGSIVTTSAMKNISTKAKQQLEKNKKKVMHVKLVCCSLMLCYNKIRELSKFQPVMEMIMPDHTNLQWIDLSHNYLERLEYDFAAYPHLRTLYLHCNFLYDLNDFKLLSSKQNLKTFNIHGNPLTQIQNFRCLIISMLPNLKKIDSVLVSKKERDNAAFLRTQIKKFPLPKNPIKPPIEKEEEEQQQKEGI